MNAHRTVLLVLAGALGVSGCGSFADGGDHDAGGGADVRPADGSAGVDVPSAAGDAADAAVPADGAVPGAAEVGPVDVGADVAGADAGAGDAVDARVAETFLVGILDQAQLVRVDPASGVTTPIGP